MPQLIPTSTSAPAIDTTIGTSSGIALPTLQSWGVSALLDYSTGKLKFNDSMELVLGDEATSLSQRITAVLTNVRLKWPIHSEFFGTDFNSLIGKRYPAQILKSIAETLVRDALEMAQDSRIVRLKSVNATVQGKYVFVTFTIVTTMGFEKQFQGKWSV